jgi:hypothetical protein
MGVEVRGMRAKEEAELRKMRTAAVGALELLEKALASSKVDWDLEGAKEALARGHNLVVSALEEARDATETAINRMGRVGQARAPRSRGGSRQR